MGWKEFFKPTIPKIIVSVILFFLIAYFSPCYYIPEYIPPNGPEGWWSICRGDSFDILFGRFVYDWFPHLWGVFWYSSNARINIFPFLIITVLSYLPSSLIIILFKKFRK